MHCAKCGFANPEGVKFCIGCGVALQHCCPSCGVENLPQARFCGECGTSLAYKPKGRRGKKAGTKRKATLDPRPINYTPKHLAQRILAEQAALEARGITEGERKTITALFADIKGSMDLIEDLDPEDARRLVDPAL